MKVKQSKYVEAEVILRKVLSERQAQLTEDDEHIVHSLQNLAECLHQSGISSAFPEGIALYMQALHILERTHGSHNSGLNKASAIEPN